MVEATLHEHQSRLLGLLTIKAAQSFGAETFLIEEGGVRPVRMARVGDDNDRAIAEFNQAIKVDPKFAQA